MTHNKDYGILKVLIISLNYRFTYETVVVHCFFFTDNPHDDPETENKERPEARNSSKEKESEQVCESKEEDKTSEKRKKKDKRSTAERKKAKREKVEH